MSLRNKFGTNKDVIEQGAWIDICENEDGTVCRLRVKRMNQQNPKFQKEMANHRNAFQGDHFSAKKIDQVQASMIEVVSSSIIVDWEFMDGDGVRGVTTAPVPEGFPEAKPDRYLPFTRENVRLVLLEFPDLLDLITAQASDISNFQAKEADTKN